jgi:hypothetical protein
VPPAFSIGYETPLGPRDSGFTVLFEDAPDPDELDGLGEHPALSSVCLHCLIDDHPEIGRGLDVAREWGAADLDENGEWIGRVVDGDVGSEAE